MNLSRRSFAARALAVASVAATASASETRPQKRAYGSNARSVYSNAVQWGSLLFLSGKGSGTAPDPADIRSCTRYVLQEFAKDLTAAGSSLENVLKVTVYLQRPEDVPAMNEVFAEHFAKNPPARTTIVTRTPHPTLVEMDLIAGV